MAWTDDRVDILKKLWAEGLSASQIATKMGGVTRNAVIGKVHRLGLSGRATPAKPQRGRVTENERPKVATPKSFRTVTREPRNLMPEPEFLEPLILDSGVKATIPTLKNDMCKWPIGDPAAEDFHFCGQNVGHGKSYCAYHAHMAFQPSNTKRERKPIAPAIAASRRAAG